MNMTPNLMNVVQGSAEVWLNGMMLGHVTHSYTDGYFQRGWYSYDHRGLRISEWPNHKRESAVREVVTFHIEQNKAA